MEEQTRRSLAGRKYRYQTSFVDESWTLDRMPRSEILLHESLACSYQGETKASRFEIGGGTGERFQA